MHGQNLKKRDEIEISVCCG